MTQEAVVRRLFCKGGLLSHLNMISHVILHFFFLLEKEEKDEDEVERGGGGGAGRGVGERGRGGRRYQTSALNYQHSKAKPKSDMYK